MKSRITYKGPPLRTMTLALIAGCLCSGSVFAQSPSAASPVPKSSPPAATAPADLAPTTAPPGVAPATTATPMAVPANGAPKAAAALAPNALTPLGWLRGCWEGKVNGRDFREEWLPLDGDTMVGASQTTLRNKTASFEFLRLEQRSDGVYYVLLSQGKSEEAFRLASSGTSGDSEIFTFVNANAEMEFPRNIIYRRGNEGWLYATVEGKVKGTAKQVIFPMRRVDCKTGDVVDK